MTESREIGFSFTSLSLILAIILLCLWRIFDAKIIFWMAIGFFTLWIFLGILEDIFDKRI